MRRPPFIQALLIVNALVAMTIVVPFHLADEHGHTATTDHHDGGDHPDEDHQLVGDLGPVTPELDFTLADAAILTDCCLAIVPAPACSGFSRPADQRLHPPNDSYKPSLARGPPHLHV